MKVAKLLLITLLGGTSLFLPAQTNTYDLDETYPIPSDGILELHSNDAEVTITGTDREDVHLLVHREVNFKKWPKNKDQRSFFIEVELEDDKVVIRERQESGSGVYWVNERSYTIELRVPHSLNLKLYGDDDDYLVQHIAGNILLHAEDGDAELKQCTGEKFDLQMDDGVVYLSQGRGELKIRGEDGEFMIERGDFHKVSGYLDDGTVYLSTIVHDDGYYSLRTEDGDLDLDLRRGGGEIEIQHDDGRVRFSNKYELKNKREHRKTLYLAGGNAHIVLRTDDGDINLK